MIPNHSGNTVSGWINYSCKVTSHKIYESEMEYRGSKSGLVPVKEQRVDGSYAKFALRCTLMDFERNYQVKVLSNQINKRLYTSINTHKPIYSLNSSLNPWFLTGFADAECSFSILIQANSRYTTGWRVKSIFAIGLHKRDRDLLQNIQSFLEIGKIHINREDSLQLRVDSPEELKVVISHFDNYPLVTAKWADYILFKQALEIILLREHLTKKGLLKIIGIKSSLNLGINENLKKAFPFPDWKNLQVDRPSYIFGKSIPNPNWMAGFVSGDGSFNIKISNSPSSILEKRVQLRFAIGLHIRDEYLIKSLNSYFGLSDNVKNIYTHLNSIRLEVVKFSDLSGKIIPFFEKYSIQGKKASDFIKFKQAAEIISKKDHLTSQGLNKILDIKARINK